MSLVLPFLTFLLQKIFSKKWCGANNVYEEPCTFDNKKHLRLQFVNNVWLKRLVLHLCPCAQFPSKKNFTQCPLGLVEKFE
jgi:hypothetical protein